jgi:hypothetical protein
MNRLQYGIKYTVLQTLELLGSRPEIKQMNLLDLTLTKSKLEPIVGNLQSLATDADRIRTNNYRRCNRATKFC